jgi:hypothetical protein
MIMNKISHRIKLQKNIFLGANFSNTLKIVLVKTLFLKTKSMKSQSNQMKLSNKN